MYSLNQVKKVLETIATNHKQINSFGFGDIWEFTTESLTMGVMWAELKDSSFSLNGKSLLLSMSLYFMDLVKKDEGNETEVLSDQLQIAGDVISILDADYNDSFFVDPNVPLTPFTEKSDDEVSGWKADLVLRIPFTKDTCVIPD